MKRDSTKARRICFDTHKQTDDRGVFMVCHLNKCRIDPIRSEWRADHIRRHAEGGLETADNLWPICKVCDQKEKAPDDAREVAKGKRVHDQTYGIKVARNPMPGSRRSKYKKHMDGRVSER